MIYFIGGAPRIGKSIVASELAKKINAELISTDELENKVSSSMSEDERSELFPLQGFSGDPNENSLTVSERVKLQIIGARSLENELEKIVTHALENNRSVVIEGVHILPQFIRRLTEDLGGEHFCVVFIGSENV